MCKSNQQLQEFLAPLDREQSITLYDCLKGNERREAYKAVHIHRIPEVTIDTDSEGAWLKAIDRYGYGPLADAIFDHLELVIPTLDEVDYFNRSIGEYVEVHIFNNGKGRHDYGWLNQQDDGTFISS